MKETSIELYKLLVRVKALRDELDEIGIDIRRFIEHTDYVLPDQCLTTMHDVEYYAEQDAKRELESFFLLLASALIECEEGKEPEQDNEEESMK